MPSCAYEPCPYNVSVLYAINKVHLNNVLMYIVPFQSKSPDEMMKVRKDKLSPTYYVYHPTSPPVIHEVATLTHTG